MQPAASQQFLNHEKLPHILSSILPQNPLFLPQGAWGCEQHSVHAHNGPRWVQGKDKEMMVKVLG